MSSWYFQVKLWMKKDSNLLEYYTVLIWDVIAVIFNANNKDDKKTIKELNDNTLINSKKIY